MILFKNYNIADWFSFYRIAAAPVLLLFIFIDERDLFSWFLLVSYTTDAIDGFLARKLQISSSRGSQLDSLGDQITFTLGVLGLFFFETEFMTSQLVLLLLVFVPYLLQMILAYKKYGRATAFHTYFAKLSALTQGVFILSALFFSPAYWLFYAMVVIGVLETIEEIILIFMYDIWVKDVKGIYWALKDERRCLSKNPKL